MDVLRILVKSSSMCVNSETINKKKLKCVNYSYITSNNKSNTNTNANTNTNNINKTNDKQKK